ncbi:MAG: hypothetical protein GY906_24875 [bacterium]|nr:hypothetical protein [bacterium]
MKNLLLLLLLAPMFVWAQSDCPSSYPPDTCDEGGIGVTPIAPPPILDCPCYTLNNLLIAYDTCGGIPGITTDDTPPSGFALTSCEAGPVVTTWTSVNDADSCEVFTDDYNVPDRIAGEIAINASQSTDCFSITTLFAAARP